MELSAPLGLETSLVEDELNALQRDHAQLIEMGQSYGSFDVGGKSIFIDKLEEVAERWKVAFRSIGVCKVRSTWDVCGSWSSPSLALWPKAGNC